MLRKGSEAIHIVKSQEPFEIGESVMQKIDWERRHDHMQQHSGILHRHIKICNTYLSYMITVESCRFVYIIFRTTPNNSNI